MPMTPQQQAGYQAWLASGAQGSPPAWVMVDETAQAAQQQVAQQAVQAAQNSGLGGFYDLTGQVKPTTPAPTNPGFSGLLGGTSAPPPVEGFDPYAVGNQPVETVPGTGLQPPQPDVVLPDIPSPTGPGYSGFPGSGETQGTGRTGGSGATTTPGAGGTTGPGTTGQPTGNTTTGGTKPTYSQLIAQWRAANPNNPNPSGDEFNAWASSVAPNGWTDDGPQTYGPQSGPQNYNQTQTGNQTGAFNTNNTTSNTANQTTGGTSNQNVTGTVNTTNQGTTAQNTTQQQTGGQTGTFGQNTTGTTSGTTTTGVTDTLGFGGLLQGAAGGAQANDATRNAYLTDLVNTGGSAYGSQLDQGIRQALSGPRMTGAGDSAQARASGYAAAQIARNNTDQRLAAAQQLGGPTALTNLSTAANPYLGSTQSTTGTTSQGTTGTSSGTNFSNLVGNQTGTSSNTGQQTSNQDTSGSTTGFNNLVGSGTENTSGTATGGSTSNASGLIPQAQQVSTGGGCVLCTAGIELGLWNCLRVLRKVIAYKLSNPRYLLAQRGYFFLFTPVAVFLLGHPRLARFLAPLARAVVYEELRVAGRKLPRRTWAWSVHWIGHGICAVVGCFPVPGRVTSKVIETIARRNNIWFKV